MTPKTPEDRIAELEANLANLTNQLATNTPAGPVGDPRAVTLAAFTKLTGLHLTNIIQRGRDADTARFTLTIDNTDIRVGTIKVLWSRAELSKVLLVAIGRAPLPCKPHDWTEAIAALFAHVVEVTEALDEAFEDTVRDWLGTYARRAHNDRQAADNRDPFTDDGHLYVNATGLAKFIRREYSEQVKLTELRQALTDLGFTLTKVDFYRGGQDTKTRSSASYYTAPLRVVTNTQDDQQAA